MRSRPARALGLAALLVAGSLTAFVASSRAAGTERVVCDQFGSTTIEGRYVVQNNRWGTSATQCVGVTATGFQITRADGVAPTDGAPTSYPSIYTGCHYGNCSPGSTLPMQVGSIRSASSSIAYRYVNDATYDASYDIWLDPTPKRDGLNQTEIMIWFNRAGSIHPVGSRTGTGTVGGRTWEIWTGNNGQNAVISFVAPSPVAGWTFDVTDFVDQAVARGLATRDWYLTSIQAGFEPWRGGAGLAVDSFAASVTGDGAGSGGGGGAPPTGCRVSYRPNSWPGGFTADVAVTNTGATPIDGWSLAFALPAGQTVSNAWNAAITPTSGTVAARNLSYNASIPPGGSQSFGFQGSYSGTFARPAAFSLNGTSCAVS